MFNKAIVVILSLSTAAFCIPGQRKCTITTVVPTTATTTVTTTTTATPGPIVELISYTKELCGVEPVEEGGEAPNFQINDLTSRSCVSIAGNAQSFSYHVVPFLASAANCQLYFYTEDLCYNNGNGGTQLTVGAQNECRELQGIRSVQLYCSS